MPFVSIAAARLPAREQQCRFVVHLGRVAWKHVVYAVGLSSFWCGCYGECCLSLVGSSIGLVFHEWMGVYLRFMNCVRIACYG